MLHMLYYMLNTGIKELHIGSWDVAFLVSQASYNTKLFSIVMEFKDSQLPHAIRQWAWSKQWQKSISLAVESLAPTNPLLFQFNFM